MSSADTNIITAQQVKDLTGKAQVIRDRKLDPAIHAAQDELEQILGTTLYALIETAYSDTPQWDGEADLQEFWEDYCRYFLAWKTMEIAYPDLYAEALANGVFTRTSGDMQTIGTKQLEVLISSARNHAARWSGKMLRYLGNLTSGDIYDAYIVSVSDEPRVTKAYTGGIITRRSRWQNQYGLSYPYDGYRHDDNCCHDE